MAGLTYYDVAHGKPIDESTPEEGIAEYSIDLLWRYRFPWLILDRWNPGQVEAGLHGDREENPVANLEVSLDGVTYKKVVVTETLVLSDKGSLGTHRSLHLIFDQDVTFRYIRFRVPVNSWVYRIRANISSSQIVPMESSKLIERMPLTNRTMMESSPVRASVIGGSNSVMRYGWTKGLQSGGVTLVENASLGSSSNAILGTRLPDLTDKSVDVLILNSTVNEYFPIRDRVYDMDLSRQYVRHIQAWCAQNDVLPVFLIYPQRRVLDDIAAGREHFDQESYCIEMCEDLQIPYINVFHLARELSAGWNRPLPSMYKDDAHLNHPAAQALGASVGARVWNFWRTNRASLTKKINAKHLTHDFEKIVVAESVTAKNNVDNAFEVRRMKTSIVDQNMVTITGGHTLSVEVPDGWEVVGYTMNARRCNSSIKISGKNTLVRRADFAGYKGKDGFPFVCARSLTQPVSPLDGVVKFSCVEPELWHEHDEITNLKLGNTKTDAMEIELSEVIIRQKARTRPYLRIADLDLDLTKNANVDFALSK